MSSYVPAAIRRLVIERAHGLCEYCLIHERDSYLGFQIEHVISEKHGGLTVAFNLAMACAPCNRSKGSNIATVLDTGHVSRLFNPRLDRWSVHFRLDGEHIVGLTDVGRATASLLGFDRPDRLDERRMLIDAGVYPSHAARLCMRIE